MADRRGRTRTRAAAPLLAGLLALASTACAASPSARPSEAATAARSTAAATAAATEPGGTPTAAATSAAISTSEAPACAATDLKASHGLVEGAAGSRVTTVVLVAATACSLDLYPAMGIRDGAGSELVASTTSGSGRIDLDPDASYASDVRFANWCDPEPKFPLTLGILIGTAEVTVTGTSFPDAGTMPPCNGNGGPVLEASPWSLSP
jgi:hypothetical protein